MRMSHAAIRGYWARRGGGHIGKDGMLTIKGKRGSMNGGTSRSGGNIRTIASLLAENAASYGYHNGQRIAASRR